MSASASTLSTNPPRTLAGALRMLFAFIAIALAVNAYSYSLTAAIPIIQSDAWYFLDGFLGRFLEYGFSVGDLFRQTNPADTNLPLQKLFLFFHTRFFGMDFRLEGLLATAAAIVSVLVFASVAAGRPMARWGTRHFFLLAALASVYLSLNSTNIYTWPLAGMWFIPVLVSVTYFAYVSRDDRSVAGLVVATLVVGLLLDELAYPVLIAAAGGSIALWERARHQLLLRLAGATVLGLVLARIVYWWFNRGVTVQAGPVTRSFDAFVSPELWKAAAIPLTESVIAQQNLTEVFGTAAAAMSAGIFVLLAVAHLWFWWTVIASRHEADHVDARLLRFAAALMLLCYGLVAGIVIQRVPAFGFDYLHQPRYVLFYQLNLVALVLMAYYRLTRDDAASPWLRGAAVGLFTAFLVLQMQFASLAWKHVKYLSMYTEGVARSMGQLQLQPDSSMQCADIMTVCDYPAGKRAQLLDRLLRYRMNVFSPDFQAFYRLHPYARDPHAPAAPAAPATPALPGPAALEAPPVPAPEPAVSGG